MSKIAFTKSASEDHVKRGDVRFTLTPAEFQVFGDGDQDVWADMEFDGRIVTIFRTPEDSNQGRKITANGNRMQLTLPAYDDVPSRHLNVPQFGSTTYHSTCRSGSLVGLLPDVRRKYRPRRSRRNGTDAAPEPKEQATFQSTAAASPQPKAKGEWKPLVDWIESHLMQHAGVPNISITITRDNWHLILATLKLHRVGVA